MQQGCDAIAVVARFPEDDEEEGAAAAADGTGVGGGGGGAAELFADYRQGQGVDAIAGAEAVISHILTKVRPSSSSLVLAYTSFYPRRACIHVHMYMYMHMLSSRTLSRTSVWSWLTSTVTFLHAPDTTPCPSLTPLLPLSYPSLTPPLPPSPHMHTPPPLPPPQQHLLVPCAHAPAFLPSDAYPLTAPKACAEELGAYNISHLHPCRMRIMYAVYIHIYRIYL